MRIQDDIKRLAALHSTKGTLISLYLNWERCDGAHGKRIRSILKKREREILQGLNSEDLQRGIKEDFREISSHLRKGFPPGTQGVCVFACSALGLFDIHGFPFPFKTQVVVGTRSFLLPLARVSDEFDHGLAALVDTESARLFEIAGSIILKEQSMESEVPGRHAQGGWAQMRYQRHIEDHRDRHHREVADVLTKWVDESCVSHVILGGQERILANLQEFLPDRVRRRIMASLPLDIRTPRDEVLKRVRERLQSDKERAHEALVQDLLNQVLTDGPAVVGMEPTIEALNEGRVGRLVILREFSRQGFHCPECEMIYWKSVERCPYCAGETRPVSLEQEIVNAVFHRGGEVTTVLGDPDLARHGGVGAFLRYH